MKKLVVMTLVVMAVFCGCCGYLLYNSNAFAADTISGKAKSANTDSAGTNGHSGYLGYVKDPQGVVPDSKCAECHPRQVRLMHAHPTLLGEAKCRAITQGMVNLAMECKPDGSGAFTCHPNVKANCFGCHAVSITSETLSLIDIEKMKSGKKDAEILGHGCMTCHPPTGNRDHHLRGNLLSITKRAGKSFQSGCGRCHAEGLKKLTSGASPHDWLARHLMGRAAKKGGDRP